MGLQLPDRHAGLAAARRLRRPALFTLLGFSALLLTGCGASENQSGFERLAMPVPITEEGEGVLELWQGAWIAAMITGVVVWGLMFYVITRYRRRHDNEVPIQTRYNLPLEIFYTIFPVIMVVVFFSHTVRVQNDLLDDSPPDNVVTVVGQQWSWTFNHPYQGENVFEIGDGDTIPTLYLPVNETTRFELRSPDVIHSFSVPGFLTKLDVVPGQNNSFQATPKRVGTYAGKCFELCGTYHSRMLFNVEVVERSDYDDYLAKQAANNFKSEKPVLGPQFACSQVGADDSGIGFDGPTCGF